MADAPASPRRTLAGVRLMKEAAHETQAAEISALLRRAGLDEAEVERRTRRALAAGLGGKRKSNPVSKPMRNTHEEMQ
jgi:hypothetical protein